MAVMHGKRFIMSDRVVVLKICRFVVVLLMICGWFTKNGAGKTVNEKWGKPSSYNIFPRRCHAPVAAGGQ